MATIKKATLEYINKETKEFLDTEFSFEENNFGNISSKENSIKVSLLYSPDWNKWIDAMYYTAFSTWNNENEINLNKIKLNKNTEKLTLDFIKKRPISAVYESAIFVIKIDNIPRSMTHQIVRARKMAFNQESYRVTPAHHADVRIPDGLSFEEQQKYLEQCNNLRKIYVEMIKSGIPTEQARNILPMGTLTHIVMTTNLSALKQYIKDRTLEIAQDEHSYIVMLICKELKEKSPEFYENFIKDEKLEQMMINYGVLNE